MYSWLSILLAHRPPPITIIIISVTIPVFLFYLSHHPPARTLTKHRSLIHGLVLPSTINSPDHHLYFILYCLFCFIYSFRNTWNRSVHSFCVCISQATFPHHYCLLLPRMLVYSSLLSHARLSAPIASQFSFLIAFNDLISTYFRQMRSPFF